MIIYTWEISKFRYRYAYAVNDYILHVSNNHRTSLSIKMPPSLAGSFCPLSLLFDRWMTDPNPMKTRWLLLLSFFLFADVRHHLLSRCRGSETRVTLLAHYGNHKKSVSKKKKNEATLLVTVKCFRERGDENRLKWYTRSFYRCGRTVLFFFLIINGEH